jgi:hypothetical protein
MTAPERCPRTHTPLVSESQRRAVGIAYAAKKGIISSKQLRGPAQDIFKSMSRAQMRAHLKESKGKYLPYKVHHSALAAAAHRRLQGVEMRSAAREPVKIDEDKKYYPSFCIELTKMPELKGKKIGDVFPMAIEVRVKSIQAANMNESAIIGLDILSMGTKRDAENET